MTNKQFTEYLLDRMGIDKDTWMDIVRSSYKEPKVYSYKGYTFYQTHVTTDVRRKIPFNTDRSYWAIAYLYEIDGLKEYGKYPFLTSIRECKEYINSAIEWKKASEA